VLYQSSWNLLHALHSPIINSSFDGQNAQDAYGTRYLALAPRDWDGISVLPTSAPWKRFQGCNVALYRGTVS
jgi:hypothetical protein